MTRKKQRVGDWVTQLLGTFTGSMNTLNGKLFISVEAGVLIIHPDGVKRFISNDHYTDEYIKAL